MFPRRTIARVFQGFKLGPIFQINVKFFLTLASHVMYECALRLGTESFSLEGLQRQAKCYLACINALKLVRKPEVLLRMNQIIKIFLR